MGTTKTNPIQTAHPDQQLAYEFAEFYISKINNIRDDLDNHEKYHPHSQNAVPPLWEFEPCHEID